MEGRDWFGIGFLLIAVGERLFERRYSTQAKRGERKMEWSYAALHSLHLLVFVCAALEFFLWRRSLSWNVAGIGVGLWLIAMVVRLKAILTLGRYWSLHLEIRGDHQLITDGIYRYMRHPAYSAIMLEVIAIPLTLNAWVALGIAMAAYVPMLLARWSREEREMVVKFGAAYERYRQAVPAFIPYRGRWAKPD